VANARTQYDALAETLVREHGARLGTLYGRACLMLDDAPFMQLSNTGLAFRLHGHPLADALALPDARRYDPFEPGNPQATRAGWVYVPATHHALWERLALDAMRCAESARTRQVSWTVPNAPPAPVAAAEASAPKTLAERASAALDKGFDFDVER
jgi:hypothetical protein